MTSQQHDWDVTILIPDQRYDGTTITTWGYQIQHLREMCAVKEKRHCHQKVCSVVATELKVSSDKLKNVSNPHFTANGSIEVFHFFIITRLPGCCDITILNLLALPSM